MDKQNRKIKQRLDRELQHLTFTKQQDVLRRTHPVSFKQKCSRLWNKEIEIPLIPVGAIFALLLFSWTMSNFTNQKNPTSYAQRELVEVGGNMYWKDELAKVVVFYED